MDFHSLNRRQLQSLCKLNKIPANITNVAMADALQSLQSVVGVEEFLNPVPAETVELPNEVNELMSPAPVTSCRTSVRSRVKKSYVDFVPATTDRGGRKQVDAEGANDALKTQAVASTRKKAAETSMATQDSVKKEANTVQRAYSTRRSTRLTEKKLAETGVMDRKASQPVKIGSFLEEEDSGNLVSEKSLGSETSHESDISFENTEDSVVEGSVESFSKEKVEDICEMFDNVDLEEKQNDGDKFVSNEVDNSEEENAYVVSEEHSDSLLSDKETFVSESKPSDTPSSELEDMSSVVSEMKNESLESSASTDMAGDVVHLNSENLSEFSMLDNPDGNYVAKEVTEEAMDFGPSAEEQVNISKSQVDAVLVDYLIPKDSSMTFEAPPEEKTEDTADHMDADKVAQESAADNANDAINHSIHLSAMKQQINLDGPTCLKEMTKVDNDENIVTELQGATVEDNRSVNEKAENDKPKCITELSLRQLKKQLKALTIKSNSNTNKDDMVTEARPALQVVCDNQMVTGEDH
uniref:uncharacterized protein LOC122608291 n=1 Tax=Erigeron canadensis TaxID=72917 RepID=UPI001CB8E87F|nr:uncharacterized protein LOC122608291 [Erigeron canadensis]